MVKKIGASERGSRYGRARSRILIQITILISVVVVLSGIGTFFFLRNSHQHIKDQSIERLIEVEANNFSSSYNYIAQLIFPVYLERFEVLEPEELMAMLEGEELTDIQRTLKDDLENMIDAGLLDLEKILVVVPSSMLIPETFVFTSNEESLITDWEIPDYLVSALEEEATYIWMENGIPELDLEGEYLITIGKIASPFFPGIFFAYVGIKPMHDKITAVNNFFDDEIKSANLLLGIVLGVSILIVLLILFFLLNYLIHKRITGPIDELSTAAEEVMKGDLDVEIKVHEGGEFQGLEYTFKEMVEGFRSYIARSVGEEPDSNGNANNKKVKAATSKKRRRRAGIVSQITIILMVVMIAYGVVTFFLIRNSQQRLIDKSIDQLVETEAENFFSSLDYAIEISIPAYMEVFEMIDIQEMIAALTEGRIIELQELINADMQEMVDIGFHDLVKVILVVPASGLNPKTTVWASNDESLIYEWELPDYFAAAIEEGTPYILVEDGVPELGFTGEYLITFNQVENPFIPNMPFYYIGVKSMHEEINAVNDFYDQESRRVNLYLAVILGGSIIIIILITFFFLNYLIKKQITEPMDELSTAAEKVMQGDLNVQVSIQEGEELESLKRAFNEMVESLRTYIAKSVGIE
jgi:HAMP domain-containing protein